MKNPFDYFSPEINSFKICFSDELNKKTITSKY